MEDKTDYDGQKTSSTDLMKKKILEYLFHLCNLATSKETEIADYTYETGFIRGVKLAKSLMWKHMKKPIKNAIQKIYIDLEGEIQKISVTDENQKKLEKQFLSDDASMQVLEILLTVMLFSSMSVEMKEIEITDWDLLITKTRSNEPIKLFENVINEKETTD